MRPTCCHPHPLAWIGYHSVQRGDGLSTPVSRPSSVGPGPTLVAQTRLSSGTVTGETAMQSMQTPAFHGSMPQDGHLYMQTNETHNAVVHYLRSASGEITEVERTSTRAAGSGVFKPISGQESAPHAFEAAGSVS